MLIGSIEDWIEELKNSGKLVVVEGKKDKISLELLGIKNITTINKPLYKVVDEISENSKECILLVDLDREGRRIYNQLKLQLQKNNIKINDRFRKFLFRNTNLTQIEGLISYLRKGL